MRYTVSTHKRNENIMREPQIPQITTFIEYKRN
jgi:hypothetical protein